jgi:large subunit ribosomal protein L14e
MVPGRVCVKITGRDAGRKVVILKVIDDNYVEVVDRSGKHHKVNKRHLMPTERVVDVSSEEAAINALEE